MKKNFLAKKKNILNTFNNRQNSAGDLLFNTGRYSQCRGRTILAMKPFAVFDSKNGVDQVQGLDFKMSKTTPIENLGKFFYHVKKTYGEKKWIAAGFLGFDLVRELENIRAMAIDDLMTPDIYMAFYDKYAIIDHQNQSIANTLFSSTEFTDPLSVRPPIKYEQLGGGKPVKNFSKEAYLNTVEKAREYIFDGDIFQVNLSQRFTVPNKSDGKEIFNRLDAISPAPYSGYLDCGNFKLVSSSPESFLSLKNGLIRTKPIKGTRKRSSDSVEDTALANELLNSSKDRAENVMIVDVERNDLSRVCELGSVDTLELGKLESFSNVHHLVSTIAGRLAPEKDVFDLLHAAFPSGSITGAPKIRSAEIIYELENLYRGPYTGSMGFIDCDGSAEFNILIRTIVLKDNKAFFQVGGGIVADSDPLLEYEETMHKASGMMQALGIKTNEALYL